MFECELIRKKNNKWTIGINDTYAQFGKNMKKTIIIDRINMITDVVTNKYTENNFSNTCPLFVKKYFDYKDIQHACNEFGPSLGYDIRGIYFVPLRVDYSKVLYVFKHGLDKRSKVNKDDIKPDVIDNKANTTKVAKATKATKATNDTKCFRIMKTMKPDVYELYLSDGDNLVKKGIALVQTIELSHLLLSIFANTSYDTEILVKCLYNDNFNKWVPITLSDGPIDKN